MTLGEALAKSARFGRRWSETSGRSASWRQASKSRARRATFPCTRQGSSSRRSRLLRSVPVCTTSDGTRVTQYPGEDLEALGFLKMDLLGLRTLTVIDKALALIQRRRGERLDLDRRAARRPRGVRRAAVGATRTASFNLRPECFEPPQGGAPRRVRRLVAILALGRPGPMASSTITCAAGGGKAPEYPHPAMARILAETHGIMLYQEQVMQIATRSPGTRRARPTSCVGRWGRRSPRSWRPERERFVQAAARKRVDGEQAERSLTISLALPSTAFPRVTRRRTPSWLTRQRT